MYWEGNGNNKEEARIMELWRDVRKGRDVGKEGEIRRDGVGKEMGWVGKEG
jgi:hypothetical protein